jgi:hypothetical protein
MRDLFRSHVALDVALDVVDDVLIAVCLARAFVLFCNDAAMARGQCVGMLS